MSDIYFIALFEHGSLKYVLGKFQNSVSSLIAALD